MNGLWIQEQQNIWHEIKEGLQINDKFQLAHKISSLETVLVGYDRSWLFSLKLH